MDPRHDRPNASSRGQGGFTLVELLVVTAITGIVMAGIYSTFYSQQNAYITQTEIAAMQQNLRAAIYNLKRDIRMAGYDPERTANAGVLSAASDSIQMSMDITDDPDTGNPDGDTTDPGEVVTYAVADPAGTGTNHLVRQSQAGGAMEMAAEHVDALNFVYLDGTGAITSTPAEIRAVQVTVVARTGKPIRGYVNSTAYTNQQDENIYTAPGDSHRRDVLTAQVKCRNLGLK
ncbi:MAG: prepilin-type N-terminal cleavage/methylation domain-containing protein [Desulfatiglandales bacterium]